MQTLVLASVFTHNDTSLTNVTDKNSGTIGYVQHQPRLLTFWRRIFFQILAHPVLKMSVIQKPNKVVL